MQRFEGTGLLLDIAGFVGLSGNFSFEKTTTATGDKILVGASGVAASLSAGGVGVDLTGGTLGAVLFENHTYALDATGSVALAGVPDLTLSGTASVRVNNTGTVVNETVTVGGAPLSVIFGFGEENFQGFEVTNLDIQSATLNLPVLLLTNEILSFAQSGSETTIAISGDVMFLGVNASLLLSLTDDGVDDQVLLGIWMYSFAMSDLGVTLPAPFDTLTLPEVSFVFTDLPPGTTQNVPSGYLTAAELSFFAPSYPGGSFTLELKPGLNFAGEIPMSALPTELVSAIGASPADSILLEGSVVFTLSGGLQIETLSLSAQMPAGTTLPGLSSWITPVWSHGHAGCHNSGV
ncbi:MAG: hypothetical protein QF878_09570 [SAR202 cluster bacterium]|nr:hypothetical protein [SAR202 cluster bacterium]MDP6716143.1 hypothetical protein [SAR202 cluster bacterium]